MARFKNQDLRLNTNEEVLLGSSQEASLQWDGSDFLINQVPKHDTQGYLATQEFVTQVIAGLEWQDSVISRTTDIPAGVYGERYIIPSGASGDWSGLDDTIAEYTTTWVYTTPSAGFSTWVDDEGYYYVYSASSWVRMGKTISHSNLLDTDADDHTQYLNVARHDLTARHGSAVVDHGSIGGLGDDDHSQYLTTTRHDTTDRHGSSVVDHGDINGLGDDDHSQYLLTDGTRDLSGTWYISQDVMSSASVSADTVYADTVYASSVFAEVPGNLLLRRNAGDLGILINTDGQTFIESTCFLYKDLYLKDNYRLVFGTGYDNTIVYSTTTDTLQVLDGNITNTNVIAHFSSIGLSATAFYGDGSNLTGIDVSGSDVYLGDANKLYMGDDNDSQIYHNGSHAYWDNDTGDTHIRFPGAEIAIKCTQNGSVTLYNDGLARLVTAVGGVNITGDVSPTSNLNISATGKIDFGTSPASTLYHNDSHAYWTCSVGNTYIQANGTQAGIDILAAGAVNLYHANSLKLATTAIGIDITGNLDATGSASVSGNFTAGGDIEGTTFTAAGNAGVTGFFDDGANFRITVTEGLITTIGASVSGGYQIG